MATTKELMDSMNVLQQQYEQALKDLRDTTKRCEEAMKDNERLQSALNKLGGAFSETDAKADYLRERIADIQSVGLCRIVIKMPYVYCYFSDGTRLVERMAEPVIENTISAAVYKNILKKLCGIDAIMELSASLSEFVEDASHGATVSVPFKKGIAEYSNKSERRRLFEAMGYIRYKDKEANGI